MYKWLVYLMCIGSPIFSFLFKLGGLHVMRKSNIIKLYIGFKPPKLKKVIAIDAVSWEISVCIFIAFACINFWYVQNYWQR